jgi:tryptophan-rich sensory protein
MFKKYLTLIFSILLAQLAGIVGSVFTAPNIKNWYVFLTKPFFSPPNWLFAPVWIILYILMGISAFLVWEKRKEAKVNSALLFYFIQLIFNATWSVVFFGFRSLFGGLVIIVALWFLILITLIKFWRIEKPAGYLLVPYLLWATFATILNLTVWQLNTF